MSGGPAEWLRAKLDQREAAAEAAPYELGNGEWPFWPDVDDQAAYQAACDYRDQVTPAWVLRDVASKRAILDLHSAEPGQHPDFCWHDRHELPCPTVVALAKSEGWEP